MTDLQKLKATAQATADKCPELLVTVPAGVMVELIADVERYRWLANPYRPAQELDSVFDHYGVPVGEKIDAAIAKEAK